MARWYARCPVRQTLSRAIPARRRSISYLSSYKSVMDTQDVHYVRYFWITLAGVRGSRRRRLVPSGKPPTSCTPFSGRSVHSVSQPPLCLLCPQQGVKIVHCVYCVHCFHRGCTRIASKKASVKYF